MNGDIQSEVLPECTRGFSDIRLSVGLIENRVEGHDKLIDKLAEGIEKIEEMNNNLVKMLTVHEHKHEIHEKIEDDIEEDVEKLHSRITTTTREIQDRIDDLKEEINKRFDALAIRLTPIETPEDIRVKKTLQELDRWKFLLMAIAIGLIFLFDHVNWTFLEKIFSPSH